MELLGQTKTGTYIFQSSLQQKHNLSGNLDKSPKTDNPRNFNENQTSTFIRAPFSALGATGGRHDSTHNYRSANVLGDAEIPKMGENCKLTTLTSAKLTSDFLEARNGHLGSITFAKEDWKIANNSNICASERVLAGSELMRLETIRACSEVYEKTQKAQTDSTKRLEDRTKDVDYWKNEMHKEMGKLLEYQEPLENLKRCISKALKETEMPLEILVKCLEERKNRKEIDMVDDDVDHEIRKTITIIREMKDHLKSNLYTVHDQLGKSNDLLKTMSNNISNKFVALKLDNSCKKLTNTSKGLCSFLQVADPCNSSIEGWLDEVCDLIHRCQQLCTNNAKLQDQSLELLSSCSESMNEHWSTVQEVFSVRISEYLSAMDKLDNQLKKVLEELVDAQKTIEYVKKNIKDLRKPLQVVQTRMTLRSQRPFSEGCLDAAHEKLSKEIFLVGLNAEELEAKLREAEFIEQNLLQTKRSLEQDMKLKSNSLRIDRDICLGLMRSFNMLLSFLC